MQPTSNTLNIDLNTEVVKTYPPEFFLALGKGMAIEVEEPEDFPFEEEIVLGLDD